MKREDIFVFSYQYTVNITMSTSVIHILKYIQKQIYMLNSIFSTCKMFKLNILQP